MRSLSPSGENALNRLRDAPPRRRLGPCPGIPPSGQTIVAFAGRHSAPAAGRQHAHPDRHSWNVRQSLVPFLACRRPTGDGARIFAIMKLTKSEKRSTGM